MNNRVTTWRKIHAGHDLAQSQGSATISQAAERVAASVNATIAEAIPPVSHRNIVGIVVAGTSGRDVGSF